MNLASGVRSGSKTQAYSLWCSLYGLKQAPCAWLDKFRQLLHKLGFNPSSHDSSMFFHRFAVGITILLVYVDNVIVTGADTTGINYMPLCILPSTWKILASSSSS